MNIIGYFLGGKRLSRTRVTPHDAAPPITPPAIVLPTNAAPATTIGATFASGEVATAKLEDEKSMLVVYNS